MLIALSVIVIILSFSLVPFIVAVSIDGDVFAGAGNIKLTLFGLPVFKAKFSVESNSALEKNLIIESGKKREDGMKQMGGRREREGSSEVWQLSCCCSPVARRPSASWNCGPTRGKDQRSATTAGRPPCAYLTSSSSSLTSPWTT